MKTKMFITGLLLLSVSLMLSGCFASSDDTGSSSSFNWTAVVMVVILLIMAYFLIIRPQNNRRKEQQKLLSELKPGAPVIAAGGIYGEVESIYEDSVVIKVESGAKIRVMKQGLMIKKPPVS